MKGEVKRENHRGGSEKNISGMFTRLYAHIANIFHSKIINFLNINIFYNKLIIKLESITFF